MSCCCKQRTSALTRGITSPISYKVGEPPLEFIFVIQPEDQEVYAGEDAEFEVLAVGDPEPTYQWYVKIE